MRRRLWRWAVAIAITAAAVAATAWVWLRYDFEKVNWTWGVIAGFVAVYLVVDQVFKDRTTGPGVLAAQRRALLDELADLVRRDPTDDAILRALEEPYPLPVRWANAPEDMQPPWRTICRSSDATPLDLGQADTAHACFARIASGRLLVLGAPGSGKSVMALRLARHLATDRSPDSPVPVLLSVSSWDPTTTTFYEWIVAQIGNRYPQLAGTRVRWQEALRELVESDMILPILDGLDEVSEDHAARCLEEFNELPAQRLVLTCRSAVYERYRLEGEKLRGAAVVVIRPLDPAHVANYLVDAAPFHQVDNWSAVAKAIARTRDGELAGALSTPLMVAMARTAFDEPGTDPQDLVLLAQARGRQSVEDTLLTSAIEAALRSRRRSRLVGGWEPEAASRYLSFLASHLEVSGRRDFQWWRLPAELPRALWVLFDGVRAALAVAVALRLARSALMFVASTVQDPAVRDAALALADGEAAWVILAGGASAVGSIFDRGRTAQGVPPIRIVFRGGPRAFAGGVLYGMVSGAAWGLMVFGALSLFDPPGRIMEFADRYSLPIDAWSDEVTVALTVGLARLVFVALHAGLGLRFAASADESGMTTAARLARGDRAATIFSVLPTCATAVALTLAVFGTLSLANALPDAPPLAAQVYAGLGLGLGVWIYRRMGSAWVRFGIARFVLGALGSLPLRLLRFLTFADAVGLLRAVGGAYRFRHARLQTRLARTTPQALALGWRQHEFATELARAGYWDEALSSFGTILTARAGDVVFDDTLASESLRKSVFVGCLGGRWRQLEQSLMTIPVPVVSPGVPWANVAEKSRAVSRLVYDGAPLPEVLEACDELIDLEAMAGWIEPSTLEFRATLLVALDETSAADVQLQHLVDGADGADVERAAPIAAALLARSALEHGKIDLAVDASERELRSRDATTGTDLLLRAERWRWSAHVLARVYDEVEDLRRRLIEAAQRARGRGRFELTQREIAETVFIACANVVSRPILGALVVPLAREVVDRLDDGDGYLRTANRSAPMWL